MSRGIILGEKHSLLAAEKFASFPASGDTTLILRVLSASIGAEPLLFHGKNLPWIFTPVPSPMNMFIWTLGAKGVVCSSWPANACLMDCAPEFTWPDSGTTWKRPTEEGAWSLALHTLQSHGCLKYLWLWWSEAEELAENYGALTQLKDQEMGLRQWMWPQVCTDCEGNFIHSSFIHWVFLCSVPGSGMWASGFISLSLVPCL